jgi:hypothetical protein
MLDYTAPDLVKLWLPVLLEPGFTHWASVHKSRLDSVFNLFQFLHLFRSCPSFYILLNATDTE